MSATDHFAESGYDEESGPQDVPADIELVSAERVVFFSDAVAAIAITLLALNLYVPPSGATALHQLRVHFLSYLAFVISFLVIARHWRTHHFLFADVTRLTTRIISVNFLWLLMIVITPFATRVLTASAFHLGFTLYALVQIATLLTVLVMTRQIRGNSRLRAHQAGPARPDDTLGLLTAAAMFAISIPFAFLVREWAFAFWAATPYVTRFIRRIQAKSP
jgi:uncharacterized membrane protein